MASKTASTKATAETAAAAAAKDNGADVVVTSAGEALTGAQIAAAMAKASPKISKEARAQAKALAAKPSTKADDRRKLADRVLAHVATMELSDDEKKLVANWLFGLPMNRDNWPAVLPKPTRGIWVKDAAATTDTK